MKKPQKIDIEFLEDIIKLAKDETTISALFDKHIRNKGD